MFYEEREFSDGWYYRTTPGGQWIRGRLPENQATSTPTPADGLPPLPEPALREQHEYLSDTYDHYYTADQMREYAQAAALRLREGCEGLVREWRYLSALHKGLPHVDQCRDDLARVLGGKTKRARLERLVRCDQHPSED